MKLLSGKKGRENRCLKILKFHGDLINTENIFHEKLNLKRAWNKNLKEKLFKSLSKWDGIMNILLHFAKNVEDVLGNFVDFKINFY